MLFSQWVNLVLSTHAIMAALRGRCGHYIFVLVFVLVSSFYLLLLFFLFLAYSQPPQIRCQGPTILPHMVWS